MHRDVLDDDDRVVSKTLTQLDSEAQGRCDLGPRVRARRPDGVPVGCARLARRGPRADALQNRRQRPILPLQHVLFEVSRVVEALLVLGPAGFLLFGAGFLAVGFFVSFHFPFHFLAMVRSPSRLETAE